jgi:hypothetical protein
MLVDGVSDRRALERSPRGEANTPYWSRDATRRFPRVRMMDDPQGVRVGHAGDPRTLEGSR